MVKKNIVGLLVCLALFCAGFIVHGNIALYFNLSGFLIVVGGTFGATFLSYPTGLLGIVFKVLKTSYTTRPKEAEEIVEILVDLSVKSRFKGILSLQEDENETTLLFLRRALGLLVDGASPKQILDILKTEIYFFKVRRGKFETVLRNIADLLPSFGLVGSVVGLIAMLGHVENAEGILKTVPIALTSTLYGIIFSNFFFLPFAANLNERTEREILLKKIILEGVIAIQSEMDPRTLETRLKSFLTPASRRVKLVSYQKIQKRFNIKPNSDYVPGKVVKNKGRKPAKKTEPEKGEGETTPPPAAPSTEPAK